MRLRLGIESVYVFGMSKTIYYAQSSKSAQLDKNKRYRVCSNYQKWWCSSLRDAKRKARQLLKAKRLFSTHDFTCGPQGEQTARLYYDTMQALRQDQDGSAGVQIEFWG